MSDRGGKRVLLADIGGTNARFAILRDGELGPVTHVPVAGHARFADALRAYLRMANAACEAAILAVAGVVADERCALTNAPWVIDAAELRAAFNFDYVRLVNDFEAIAWALPHLAEDDVCRIGGGAPVGAIVASPDLLTALRL